MGIADKTYDRAHIMELPVKRDRFRLQRDLRARQPVSVEGLRRAFEEAKGQYSDQAARAYGFLENQLRETLGSRFSVGWGHRLERQMENYVPVILASGGSLGEAVDYVLATKILRKIQNRYGIRHPDLKELRASIETSWKSLNDFRWDPVKSRDIVDAEDLRVRRDYQVEAGS